MSFVKQMMLFFCLLGRPSLTWAQPVPTTGELADRLLVEVNHFAYTQRQLELYVLTVDTLKGSESYRIANESNWLKLLDDFRSDMVVDQEALRIGSFDPTRKMLDKALEIINQKIAAVPMLGSRFNWLNADKASLTRTAAQALRVENFRRSKQRQAAIVSGKDDPNTINITTRFNVWQKDLEDRAILRYFDDAKVFVSLKGPK